MGRSRFGFSSLVATATLAFFVLLVCPIAFAAQKVGLTSSLPPTLRDRLSPLTTQQVDYYGKLIKKGGANAMTEDVLSEFCKSARLLCGAFVQQTTLNGMTTAPSSKSAMSSKGYSAQRSFWHTGLIDRSFFRGWAVEKGTSTHESIQARVIDTDAASSTTNRPASEGYLADRSFWHGGLIDKSFHTGCSVKKGRQNQPSTWVTGKTEDKHKGLQQHETTSIGTYFQEKDLQVGAKLVLPIYLYEPSRDGDELSTPSFLPASLALSLPPFDSHHLIDLLQLFHIPDDSPMVQQIKKVLDDCDQVKSLGKDNDFMTSFCATSFEAMLNFASSMLNATNNMVQALANSKVVGRPGSQVTIVGMAQLAPTRDAVDCHDLTFPFKVMGCHRIKDSKAFIVRLASDQESLTMDLLVACHKNTSLFNPQHEAFCQLKSSPGHTDICHWLPNNDNMWIPL